jgi:exonuclease VII small subunit
MNTSEFRRLTREAEAMVESLDARERELAAAAEQLSQGPAVQASFQQGVEHERRRVLTLISIQLDLLKRGGINALVLDALRRQVLEARQ